MKTKVFIGIDPGKSGCLVALDYDAQYITHLQVPIWSATGMVKGAEIVKWIIDLSRSHQISAAFIEKVGARTGQGVVSMFNFGRATGVVIGAVAAIGLEPLEITPQCWKKEAGLIGEIKDFSRIKALETYPQLKDLQKKGAGQALADAIFICQCGIKIVKKMEF